MYHVLCIIIVVLVTTLLYIIKQRHFKLRGNVPGLEPHLFLGNLWQLGVLSGKSLSDVWSKLHEMYGDTFQYWAGWNHYYVFNKLEHVIHVLCSENIGKYERTYIDLHLFRRFQAQGLEALIGKFILAIRFHFLENFKMFRQVSLELFVILYK
jgi:hypothetical protein